MSTRLPVFFISHGGPNLLEDQAKPGKFYSWFGKYLQALKPKGIVIISAHWQGHGHSGIYVDTSEKPKLIYDFYNFPRHYYQQQWDHQGSPALADRVLSLLNHAGVAEAKGKKYGNDHGVWVPLKRAMESNPDIPIVEVSTFEHEDMDMHVKMGEALAPLREDGIVIIGSGSAVHNLSTLWTYGDKPSPKYVVDFDKDLQDIACRYVGKERCEKAIQLDQHTAFRRCHPTAEHLVPFHVAVGAAGEDKGRKLITDFFSTISWGCFGFGLPQDVVLPEYN
ncbi:aromatic ring-opening dioxygenase LigB subunit [Gilbertella persicaria]|uniref:Extradiol ring-cleavage dioxygenase class III enzyme subunit B domain-containing protein n=1 Tax=Rhizopus stolonifer TaxID=4846 RepID=A0A367KYC9_RHIST|nr:aromatic ring-opening dioxygenase LigB subunit [Gilbertella persicaria]KAI8091315.1 aromatic ring-opening dioxygenase LigB subunit [Gilbertella persicaria]RCI07218.1 hypothetical protein CU098_012400 [Rhizopus stolonifer]